MGIIVREILFKVEDEIIIRIILISVSIIIIMVNESNIELEIKVVYLILNLIIVKIDNSDMITMSIGSGFRRVIKISIDRDGRINFDRG